MGRRVRAYGVQKLLFHMNTRTETLRRWDEDRDALLAEYRIGAEERRLLETGDYGALWEAGVHELILMPFAMHSGIKWPDYLEAMANPGPTVAAGGRR